VTEEQTRRKAQWDLFMVVVALASLVPIVLVEVRDLHWSDPLFRKLALYDLGFVAFFFCELSYRFVRADDKKKFFRQNWYELIGLVPMYAESLAWLRAVRVVRIFRVFRALRTLRAITYVARVVRESRLGATFVIALGIMLGMAYAFLLIERDTNPNIKSYGDAAWWAVTTTATVGYGDIVPHSAGGRALASLLMLFGIGFFGVVASSLTTAILRIGWSQHDLDASLKATLRRHEDLVVRRERGDLSQEEYEKGVQDLVVIARRERT
jgi:voltage-gated potassium channel